MFTHRPVTWRTCARSEMQAHLPVTPEEERGGRWGEENSDGGRKGGKIKKGACFGKWPSIPIEISHSHAGCSPEAGGFALETAPVAIFGT